MLSFLVFAISWATADGYRSKNGKMPYDNIERSKKYVRSGMTMSSSQGRIIGSVRNKLDRRNLKTSLNEHKNSVLKTPFKPNDYFKSKYNIRDNINYK